MNTGNYICGGGSEVNTYGLPLALDVRDRATPSRQNSRYPRLPSAPRGVNVCMYATYIRRVLGLSAIEGARTHVPSAGSQLPACVHALST